MNRGLAHGDIFLDPHDRELFLGLLAEVSERWEVQAHGYVLMGNHYHLLLRDVRGELSRAMRHVGGVYTYKFNRRHGRDGPLFRGRFRSKVVQDERYVLTVLRYIDLNPVQAGLVRDPIDYAWSSHRAYVIEENDRSQNTGTLLDFFGVDRKYSRQAYRDFVNGVSPDFAPDFDSKQTSNAVYGDEEFYEQCRERVRKQPKRHSVNVPAGRQMAAPTIAEVILCVAEALDVQKSELCRAQRGHANFPRSCAVWLCVKHTLCNAAEIGEAFELKPGAVRALSSRVARQIRSSRKLQAQVARIEQRLQQTVELLTCSDLVS